LDDDGYSHQMATEQRADSLILRDGTDRAAFQSSAEGSRDGWLCVADFGETETMPELAMKGVTLVAAKSSSP